MVLLESTLVEAAPLESSWFFAHTGPSVPWVSTVGHHVIVRSLFPLPLEGMEEGCKGLFDSQSEIDADLFSLQQSEGPHEAETKTV